MSFAEARAPSMGNNLVAMASHGNDSNLHVEFYIDNVYQEFESLKEGRAIYKPVNKVRISQPGGKSDIIKTVQMEDEPNSPAHPRRFPGQWAAFQAQQEQVPNGMPLEMCKFIAGHRVLELKAQRIHTAEQMAELPDTIMQTLGMGAFHEREQCRIFLKKDDSVERISAALAENDGLKADMEALKLQMAQLASLKDSTDAEKPRRGRPPLNKGE